MELLRLPISHNDQCGVSLGNSFATAYIELLRSTGLTRQQEVYKIYQGGVLRASQMTLDSFEEQKKAALLPISKSTTSSGDVSELEQEEILKNNWTREEQILRGLISLDQLTWDEMMWLESTPYLGALKEQEYIKQRSTEILQEVWSSYSRRLVLTSAASSSRFSKEQFEEDNLIKAETLAKQEYQQYLEEQRAKRVSIFILNFIAAYYDNFYDNYYDNYYHIHFYFSILYIYIYHP
jgi:hypothetical protein